MGDENKLNETLLKFYLDNAVGLIHAKLDGISALMHERYTGLDSRLKALEAEVEDTSNHNIQNLQEQIKERKEGNTRWSGYIITFVSGIIITLIGGVIGLLTIYIASKFK
jgi:hypothetical protein